MKLKIALRTLLLLACVALQTSCANLGRTFEFLPSRPIPELHIELDRPFPTGSGETQLLDVFRSDSTIGPRPAVVLLHGGFWLFGEQWYMDDWGIDLASQGYVAVSVSYRLLPEGGTYPLPVRDVLAAVRYLRGNAEEFHIDPERVAIFGVSAGAHLALLAGIAGDVSVFDPSWPAGESANIKAIVDIYGPTDFTADAASADAWQDALVTSFIGYDRGERFDLWREASPVTYVRAGGPPVFILHGDEDPIVPVSQARALRDALQAAGQIYEYHEIPGERHFWGSMWTSGSAQAYRTRILEFLEQHLPPGRSR